MLKVIKENVNNNIDFILENDFLKNNIGKVIGTNFS